MSSSNPNHCYALIPSLTSTANPNNAIFHDLGQRQQQPPPPLWDYWDHNTTTTNHNTNTISASAHQYPILGVNAPFIDYQQHQQQAAAPPLLPPVTNFPFYVEQTGATQAIKAEDHAVGSGGRIGLNLGYRTYFSSGDAAAIDRLFRRSRGLFPSSQPVPRCQAEGCKADLSGAKHYHRRHKVCEFHSKATVVVAAGLQQRFCQQCSRFHVLSEFDEAKRSCRKRLADHNRRRRKPQQTCTQNADNNEESNASGEMESKGPANSSGSNAAANTSGGAIGICGGPDAMVAADIGGGASRSSSGTTKVKTMTQLRKSPALSLGGSVDDHHHHYSHHRGGGVRPTLVVNSSLVGDQDCSNHHDHPHRHHHWSSSTSSSSSFFPQRQGGGGGGSSSFNEGASQLGQGLFQLDFM